MRVIDAMDEFLLTMEGVVSPKTIKWYKQKLQSLVCSIGDCQLEEVTVHNLLIWRKDLADQKERYSNHPSRPIASGGLSWFTLHGHVRACKRFFSWLEEEDYLETNIAKKLKLPPKPKNARRGIRENDRDRIIEKAKENPRDYAMVMFLADTACRAAGLAGLKINELDLENYVAVVHEKGKGGNKKARLVYFGEKTKQAVRNWLEIRPETPGCNYVFISIGKGGQINHYHGLTVSGVYQVLKRIALEVGISEGFNPHNWRHGAARGMIKKGASLIEVCQILGHSSITVTGDFYGTFSEDEIKESHREYSWID